MFGLPEFFKYSQEKLLDQIYNYLNALQNVKFLWLGFKKGSLLGLRTIGLSLNTCLRTRWPKNSIMK